MIRPSTLATLLLLTGLLGACATQPAAPPDKHQVAAELLARIKALMEEERLFSSEAVEAALNVRLEKDPRSTEARWGYRIAGTLKYGTDPIRKMNYYNLGDPSQSTARLEVALDPWVACLDKETADRLLGEGKAYSVTRSFRTPEAWRDFDAKKKSQHDEYGYSIDPEGTRMIFMFFDFQSCAKSVTATYLKKAP